MNTFNLVAYADPYRINRLNHGREFEDVGVSVPVEERMYAPRVSGAISEQYRAESKDYIFRMTKRSFRIMLMSTYTREILVI